MRRHHWPVTAFFLALVACFAQAGTTGTTLVLPSVGRGPGSSGSQWRTTLWVHNPAASTANVEILFLKRQASNPSPPSAFLSVAPGATERIADAFDDLFGIDGEFGAFLISSDQAVVANARIFSEPPEGEASSVGQFFSATTTDVAISSGESTSVLGVFQLQPKEASPFRYNFGFAEVLGQSVQVKASLLDETGVQVASKTFNLGEWGVEQKNVDEILSGVDGENYRLSIEVTGGNGKVVAFGSGIANVSNDPSTFEMTFDRAKLGTGGGTATTVTHDQSLTGDGSAGSPLGVASGGIGPSHLGTVDSPQSGEVLTYTSQGMAWESTTTSGGPEPACTCLYGDYLPPLVSSSFWAAVTYTNHTNTDVATVLLHIFETDGSHWTANLGPINIGKKRTFLLIEDASGNVTVSDVDHVTIVISPTLVSGSSTKLGGTRMSMFLEACTEGTFHRGHLTGSVLIGDVTSGSIDIFYRLETQTEADCP